MLDKPVVRHTLYALGTAVAVGVAGLPEINHDPYVQLACAMVGAFLVACGFGVAKRSTP